MKRGMTLGKFAPLHRGHQLLIETALAEMDEVMVIIYEASDVTPIPLGVRSEWIRALYPTIRVIEAWGGPSEVGYTVELMRMHEQYIIERLGVTGVTHFYSSEPYGEHISDALGAIDRRVDPSRHRLPISASRIRKDPFGTREYMHPVVYRDLIANLVFVGAPCSGKTTLTQRLAKEFATEWMPEFGRAYWEANQVNRRLSQEQLVDIARGHLEREEALLAKANQFLFTDTNAITTATFARYYHGTLHPELAALAAQAVNRYDLVFLCDIDFTYVHTSDRSGEVNRLEFQRQVVGDLHYWKVPYMVLSGNVEERVSQVRSILARFVKFTNVLDLVKAKR